jgi:predicted phage gp36 major capsid-like protein
MEDSVDCMPDHYHEAVRVRSEDMLTDLLELDVEGELADRQKRIQDQIEEVHQELDRRERIHEENERDLLHQIDYQEELIDKIEPV